MPTGGSVAGRTRRALVVGVFVVFVSACASTVPAHVKSLTGQRLTILQSDPAIAAASRLFSPSGQPGTSYSCDGDSTDGQPPHTWVETDQDLRTISAKLVASIEAAGWTPGEVSVPLPGDYFQYFHKSFGSWTSIMAVELNQTGGGVYLYTTQSDTCYGWLADTVPSPKVSSP
jgi:hypothetical protein